MHDLRTTKTAPTPSRLMDLVRQAGPSGVLDELINTLSHEVRTPLGAIAAANAVLQSAQPGSPDALEAAAIIERQAQLLVRLMDDMRRARQASPLLAEEMVAPAAKPVPCPRRNVLLVEDNDDALALLRCGLELDGHTVSTAANGLEGLSQLLALKPEVSIVDIGLPGLTGLEMARHARACGYAGRMIALSGLGYEGVEREALVAGFDSWLMKPVTTPRLRASMAVA